MVFRPGVNFINILGAAFMRTDPESAKKTDNLTVFFSLLGSAHIKLARIVLVKVKLIPDGLQFEKSYFKCKLTLKTILKLYFEGENDYKSSPSILSASPELIPTLDLTTKQQPSRNRV